jgi:uncharacterized protein YneF (UPF0154 family)
MARFILDVNSKGSYKMSEKQIDKILRKMSEELFDGEVFIITCIDRTTDNQFYIDDEDTKYTDNKLSEKQIKNYNKILKEMNK